MTRYAGEEIIPVEGDDGLVAGIPIGLLVQSGIGFLKGNSVADGTLDGANDIHNQQGNYDQIVPTSKYTPEVIEKLEILKKAGFDENNGVAEPWVPEGAVEEGISGLSDRKDLYGLSGLSGRDVSSGLLGSF